MILLYLKDKPFRILINSNILNSIGDYLFTIIFVIYAAHIPKYANIATSIASLNILLPSIFGIILGEIANKNTNQVHTLIVNKVWQIGCFFVVTICLCMAKSIGIFLIICLFNLISEIIGNYSFLVELKLFKENVSEKNMNTAMSMSQGLTSVVNIISQTYGAILITMIDYQYFYVGIINIITFIVALIVLLLGKNSIKEEKEEKEKIVIKDLVKNHIITWKRLKEHKNILNLVIIIAFLNMLIGSISSIQNVYFINHQNMWINSYGITLAVFNSVFTLGMLIGTMTPNDFFKKVALSNIAMMLLVSLMLVSVLYALNLTRFKYILLVAIFVMTFLAGKISPRFSSLIINSVSADKIASISGIVNTIVTLSVPLGTGILLTVYNIDNSSNLVWIILIILVVLILYKFYLEKIKK